MREHYLEFLECPWIDVRHGVACTDWNMPWLGQNRLFLQISHSCKIAELLQGAHSPESNLPWMCTGGRATPKLPSSLSWWLSPFTHPSLGTVELSPLHFNSTELKLACGFKGYMMRTLQKDKAGLHKVCFIWKARQAPTLKWLTSTGNLTPLLSFSWSRFVHSQPTQRVSFSSRRTPPT